MYLLQNIYLFPMHVMQLIILILLLLYIYEFIKFYYLYIFDYYHRNHLFLKIQIFLYKN